MASSYPGAIDALTNPISTDAMNSVTVPHATQHADVNDAVEAIQGELGTDPAGAAATVKARLDTLDTTVAGKAPSADPTFTGTVVLPSTTSVGTVTSTEIGYLDGLVEPLTTSLASKTDDADLPYSVVVPAIVLPTATSSGLTQAYIAAGIFNVYLATTSGAQNTYVEWEVMVAAGTYSLRTMHRNANNLGILHISIDGGAALGTTIDPYAASGTNNNVTDITGIALTAGRHRIRYTTATKNASSTNYYISMHGFSLSRTGA